jgi:hypothetical protein
MVPGPDAGEPQIVAVPDVSEEPTVGEEPSPEEQCEGGQADQCRAHGEELIAQARHRSTTPADASRKLERAHRQLERSCQLLGLSDEKLEHKEPLYAPPPPPPKEGEDPHIARAAALRQAREFGMIGVGAASGGAESLDLPPASQAVLEYLQAHRSNHARCVRELSFVAEALANTPPLPPRAGRVRMGASSISGNLKPESLYAALGELESDLLSCYAAGLERNPDLEGRVTLRMVFFDNAGVPMRIANGGSDLPDREVIRCIVVRAYALRVAHQGLVTAVVPMLFSPAK